jgi:glutamate/tyrosine decarboxylase-like PLP-dependent enzyme
MVLQQLGRAGVAGLVARHIALAESLARRVDAARDLRRLAPVELSIVCFRYVPPGWAADDPRLDELNKRLMEHVQAGGASFLTNTLVGGRFALRACVLHHGTDEPDLDALLDAVRDAGRRTTRFCPGGGAR